MEKFNREERYMVVKLSKLDDDQGDNMGRGEEIYRIAHFGKALVEAVVIESDWPEYATVWKMLEDRVMGNPTPDHTNCHANGRKQAEQIDALQSELTKALAEVEKLKWAQQLRGDMYSDMQDNRDHALHCMETLQTDLTKARGMLDEAAGKLYVDTQLKLRINAFNANHSAPAAPNQTGEQS